jgi:hypothetical protein
MLIPVQYRIDIHLHGSPLRLWHAVMSSTGETTWPVETLLNDGKGLVGAMKRRVQEAGSGNWISVMETTLTVMPDEVPIGERDRVLFPDWELRALTPATLTKGVDTIGIAQGYGESFPSILSRVTRVSQGNTTYPVTAYTVDLATGVITWAEGQGPTTGTTYSAEYYYHPVYSFYPEADQDVPRPSGFTVIEGLKNAVMPVTGTLRWEPPGS